MVSAAARDAAPGGRILTSMGWHESNLAENRLPTVAELDAAAPDHPVLARRGGHLAVANSAALRAAGFGADTADPRGGKIGRDAEGRLDGVLEGGAVYQVVAHAPPPRRAELAAALGTGSAGLRGAWGRHHPRGDDHRRRPPRLDRCLGTGGC